jgi:hypothetical protein
MSILSSVLLVNSIFLPFLTHKIKGRWKGFNLKNYSWTGEMDQWLRECNFLQKIWVTPNGGARESTQGAKGICNPIGGTTLWTNQYPRALDSRCICIKRWASRPSMEREAHWTCKLYMPQYRGRLVHLSLMQMYTRFIYSVTCFSAVTKKKKKIPFPSWIISRPVNNPPVFVHQAIVILIIVTFSHY